MRWYSPKNSYLERLINKKWYMVIGVRILINCTHFLWGVRKLYQNRYLHTTKKRWRFPVISFYLLNFFFAISRILTMAGLATMFAISSNTKFSPTKNIMRYAPTEIPSACAPPPTASIKNTREPSRKIPVLTTGHTIALIRIAR